MTMQLSIPTLSADERGQVLLLTAIAIVLILLSLVTIMNVASFTQLERSSGVDDLSQDTLSKLDQTNLVLETAIDHANHNDDSDAGEHPEDRVDANLDVLEERLKNDFARDSSTINLDVNSINDNGVRVWLGENDRFNFHDPPGAPTDDWDVVTNADGVRAFGIALTGQHLEGPTSDDQFTIIFEYNDGGEEEFYIYEDTGGHFVIEHEDDTHEAPVLDGNPAMGAIDFSHGTVNGDRVDMLPHTEDIDTIRFENADNVHGMFSLVAEIADTPEFDTVEPNPGDGSDIEAHNAVYDVTVQVSISTPKSDIQTVLRITPGLPSTAQT